MRARCSCAPTTLGENSLERPDVHDSAIVRTETVTVRPLAALLQAEGLTRVDALKIDIEGMELPVMEAFFGEAPDELWPTLIITEFKETAGHGTAICAICSSATATARCSRPSWIS